MAIQNNGCVCQSCGTRYKVDFNLPDELWERIRFSRGAKVNLLCPVCIAERIEALGEFDHFDLTKPEAQQDTREFAPITDTGG